MKTNIHNAFASFKFDHHFAARCAEFIVARFEAEQIVCEDKQEAAEQAYIAWVEEFEGCLFDPVGRPVSGVFQEGAKATTEFDMDSDFACAVISQML